MYCDSVNAKVDIESNADAEQFAKKKKTLTTYVVVFETFILTMVFLYMAKI